MADAFGLRASVLSVSFWVTEYQAGGWQHPV